MDKPFKTTLANGLRVILQENHAAPVVSANLWANVGSVNETDQEAGLCHLIEHMIFKGTSRRPVGQIAKEVEAAGGDMNAYTSFDETVYYINIVSKKLDVALDILADVTSDPTFDETELTREKEVVVEEINRAEDNPSQMVSEDLFSKAYKTHNYHRPIAGNRETVRKVSREHLSNFFKRWYVGSNLILIVTGDFKQEEILRKIEGLFSKIPAGTPPSQNIVGDPSPLKPEIITREMDIQGRYFDLAVPIPNLMHSDTPALDVLCHILGGGPSSRLEQAIKEKKQLVSSIGATPYTPRYPGVMIVGGVLRDKDFRETLTGIWKEIERLKTEPPSIVEVSRARENIRSSRIYERQTVESMARKWGYYEGIAHDLNFEEAYYHRIAELSPEDIQEMAKKYFRHERLTLAFCHPKGEKWPREKIESWLPKASATTLAPKVLPKKDLVANTYRLPSGIRLLIRENHQLPLISIRGASLGGIRFETATNNGITHLIAMLLTKGTAHRTSREIAEATESISGHLDGYMGRNMLGLQSTFLSEKVTEGLELFTDLLLHPNFPEEEIVKEKGHTLTAIKNEEDSLSSVVMKKFLVSLYPKHPYGFSALGTPQTVKSLSRKELMQHYEAVVRPDNLVISIVGDVDSEDILERLKEKFAGWKRQKRTLPKPSTPKAPIKPVVIETKRPKLQAHIIYGFMGTTFLDRDRFSLEVLSHVLAGQGGRLFIELRDKQGLAYAISASTQEGIEPGHFAAYMGCDPVKLETSIEGLKKELQHIRDELVTEEELDRAKRFIIGNYLLDLQKNSTVATLLAFNEIYGIEKNDIMAYPAKIERVTCQDVLRVAKKYIRPEASILSVIKP